MWKNLKGHFSKTTFYGIHAGNNQISIWKPHSNFAFPEPYIHPSLWEEGCEVLLRDRKYNDQYCLMNHWLFSETPHQSLGFFNEDYS